MYPRAHLERGIQQRGETGKVQVRRVRHDARAGGGVTIRRPQNDGAGLRPIKLGAVVMAREKRDLLGSGSVQGGDLADTKFRRTDKFAAEYADDLAEGTERRSGWDHGRDLSMLMRR
jgi:hypothetical protein